MTIERYIEKLFADYPGSPAMEDFKEELASNLQARILHLSGKGMSEAEAFQSATAELGDVTEIANQISEDKRREVIGSMYMKDRNYLDKAHIAGYTTAGSLAFLGICSSLFFYKSGGLFPALVTAALLMLPACCTGIYFYLTQETASDYPMDKKRAYLYTAAAAADLAGIAVFAISFLGRNMDFYRALGLPLLIIFPGCILLAILLMSERPRSKPWVLEQQAAWNSQYELPFKDPGTAARFGLLSGSLWIFAASLYITLGFFIGFRYTWPVFLFATAAQLLIQALMLPKE